MGKMVEPERPKCEHVAALIGAASGASTGYDASRTIGLDLDQRLTAPRSCGQGSWWYQALGDVHQSSSGLKKFSLIFVACHRSGTLSMMCDGRGGPLPMHISIETDSTALGSAGHVRLQTWPFTDCPHR